MAFMVIEMGLETSDSVVLGQLYNCHVHAEWFKEYASEGGTCFLKFSCEGLGASSDGYIKYDNVWFKQITLSEYRVQSEPLPVLTSSF